ncbi:MAG: PepSY-like domain-containing protein [Acidobacteria bacterium]|nr:PepSY-like domain-containing protein [Acidobacteriota bacterium]
MSNPRVIVRALCAAALVLVVSSPAIAASVQATAAKVVLPAAVDAAFKKAYPKAVIKNVSKETEDGKTVYEVESTDNGLARDLVYLPDGTVLSYEEVITVASLPAAVTAAIKARYPKATISVAEKAFSNGVMNYEVVLKGADVTEVELTPEGKWISPAIKKSLA